jgi:hypothetical protein
MTAAPAVAYDFAVLRVVPHVHLGQFVPIGVIVHARAREFLGARVIPDTAALRRLVPGIDAELLSRYLRSLVGIAAGDPQAGPIALAPPSERFHWLTAPRSDVLQCSSIHEGLCDDPRGTLDALFSTYVTGALARQPGGTMPR